MACKACNKVPNSTDNEDCFEKALDILKQHYTFYKNSLLQRDLELQHVKERNEKLNKALQLLQKNQQKQTAKRFKSNERDDSWLSYNSSQDNGTAIDLSLTDDERKGASNLNVALNSEQLFDISALSQTKNDVSITTSSEMVQSPRVKETPKRNKQRDNMLCLKQRSNKNLERSKSEWQSKECHSPVEKSWTLKCLQPSNKPKSSENKMVDEMKKPTDNKRLCLSLKKTNPSKLKQSVIHFRKSKDDSFRESDMGEDIIDASPMIANKNSKAGRSWAHRSVHNHSTSNKNSNITNNSSTNIPANVAIKKHDTDRILDDIVFDFSPTKKTDSSLELNSPQNIQPKQLKYDNDISTDCTSLPNNHDHLVISSSKSDTSSVVILTPGTQDIIFVDDTCNDEPEIDTMDLMADDLENLKKIESKYILQKQQSNEIDVFKKPQDKLAPDRDLKPLIQIKKEKITQDLKDEKDLMSEKPSCSKSSSNVTKIMKAQNPLFSSDELDTDDEDFMHKPFIVKQEADSIKTNKKLSIKERFGIECEDCEKLINFLDKGLTYAQIQQHLDKCKRHNNNDAIMRQNTPKDFWNPFILSFQPDDPRNEVLIDNRFKDNKE